MMDSDKVICTSIETVSHQKMNVKRKCGTLTQWNIYHSPVKKKETDTTEGNGYNYNSSLICICILIEKIKMF